MNGPGDRAPKLPSTREPRLSTTTKATAPLRRMDVEGVLPPGSKEFGTFGESFVWKLGDLESASPSIRWQAAVGTRRAVRHGGSLREVGRGHSTEEVGEDAGNARRVDGGKDRGCGETRRRKRVLDTERAKARPRNTVSRSAFGVSRGPAVDLRWEPGAGNPPAGFCPGGRPKGRSLPERLSAGGFQPAVGAGPS
jgi:hypothetical protein